MHSTMRAGKFFTRPISGNKTSFFWPNVLKKKKKNKIGALK